MSRVLILTKTFPWRGGDDFLSTEIRYWQRDGVEVFIAPSNVPNTDTFRIGSGVAVDTTLARRSSLPRLILRASRSAISQDFWREIKSAQTNDARPISISLMIACLKATTRFHIAVSAIQEVQDRHGQFDLVYSYWKDAEAFAAARLRSTGKLRAVVTRAHRYDLYPHAHSRGHMPLAERFARSFSLICPVSTEGEKVLALQAGTDIKTRVSRLGVDIPPSPAAPPGPLGTLSVVSLSHCVQVKRIDRIVDALVRLATGNPGLRVSWIHVGDGPTRANAEGRAYRHLGRLANVTYQFLGHLERDEVDGLLTSKGFDLILNVSESEGVPVSIMEAMARGIPAVATDVGGVSELVDSSCGWLLPRDPSIQNIVDALVAAATLAKAEGIRWNARSRVIEQHSASTNYARFVEECLALIARD